MRPLQFSFGECATEAGVHRNGTIFYKSVQLIAYADDIDIIGRTMRNVTAAFSAIERESAMALAVMRARQNICADDEWGRVSYGVSDHG